MISLGSLKLGVYGIQGSSLTLDLELAPTAKQISLNKRFLQFKILCQIQELAPFLSALSIRFKPLAYLALRILTHKQSSLVWSCHTSFSDKCLIDISHPSEPQASCLLKGTQCILRLEVQMSLLVLIIAPPEVSDHSIQFCT